MSMGTCGTITYMYAIEMQELHEGEYFKIPFSRICSVEQPIRHYKAFALLLFVE